jgi:hypothetical protein
LRIYEQSAQTFEQLMAVMGHMFITEGEHDKVDTGHWQSLKNVPHTKTRELTHVNLSMGIPDSVGNWQAITHPNLPWAEDHFRERVSGVPLNPGEQYKNWPWYKGGVEDHKQTGEFSHTYMERFWPKEAGPYHPDVYASGEAHHGIRYPYGDLNDLIALLAREPYTRQAYLPIWFPEDLHAASVAEQRVPCSLGYHFLLRRGRLHCFYPMRSVDFVRYLRDDLYMAGRLTQWIVERLRERVDSAALSQDPDAMSWTNEWDGVKPGDLEFMASSVHVFEGDVPKLERMYG